MRRILNIRYTCISFEIVENFFLHPPPPKQSTKILLYCILSKMYVNSDRPFSLQKQKYAYELCTVFCLVLVVQLGLGEPSQLFIPRRIRLARCIRQGTALVHISYCTDAISYCTISVALHAILGPECEHLNSR